MNFYEKRILPKVVHCVCGLKPMMRQRGKVVPEAEGLVLELGIGSGLNLSYYKPERVKHIIGIDPTPNKRKLQKALDDSNISHEMFFESAEQIPLENHSVDTVVSTYTFCTIPDFLNTIQESRRVLKKSGKLIFIEHGIAPDEKVQKTQNRINPIWKRLAGGCHLNRDIPKELKSLGFHLDTLESMYLPGWKPASWNVWGFASVR